MLNYPNKMPVILNSAEEFTLEELIAIHGLQKENTDIQFAIDDIATDLGLTNNETIKLLKENGVNCQNIKSIPHPVGNSQIIRKRKQSAKLLLILSH